MSFNGYLLKAGGTEVPLDCIAIETYIVEPNQRMETEAKRDANGKLHRKTVTHTATKIEFETPYITEEQQTALMNVLRGAWTSTVERKLHLSYYDPEKNTTSSGDFYMPDIQWKIYHIDQTKKKIIFGRTKITFIEY